MSLQDGEAAYQDWWDGLDGDTQDDFREYGRAVAYSSNPNDLDDLATAFLTHGMTDDAIRILGLKDDGVNFMQQEIQNLTGWRVNYNDAVQQWYNTDTGQFMGKLRFAGSDEDYRQNDVFQQAIIDKFGINPNP